MQHVGVQARHACGRQRPSRPAPGPDRAGPRARSRARSRCRDLGGVRRRSIAPRVPIRRRDRRTELCWCRPTAVPTAMQPATKTSHRATARQGWVALHRATRTVRRCGVIGRCVVVMTKTIPPCGAAKHWAQIPDRSGVFPTSKRPCVRHDERVLTSLRRRAGLLVWSVDHVCDVAAEPGVVHRRPRSVPR